MSICTDQAHEDIYHLFGISELTRLLIRWPFPSTRKDWPDNTIGYNAHAPTGGLVTLFPSLTCVWENPVQALSDKVEPSCC
jgi:hypothetical protein